MNIFEDVKKLNLPLGEYVVVGSGPMAARGIREYKDIDVLVTENLYKKLLNQGWKKVEINGVNGKFDVLKNGKFEVDKRLWCANYKPDTNQIIKNADLINGVSFMTLLELIKFKTALGREKDLKDIELIKNHLKEYKKFADTLPYRKNVGSVIFKDNKFLLVLMPIKSFNDYWKFPQGGVNEGEKRREAVMRELKEELGTDKFKIIKQYPYKHRYDWDETSTKSNGYKWRGQKQTFFLVEFLGTDKDIKIDKEEIENISKIKINEKKNEYYLTDLVELAVDQGVKIGSVQIDAKDGAGINTQIDLETVESFLKEKK